MSHSSPLLTTTDSFYRLSIATALLPVSLLPIAAVTATLIHACASYFTCSSWIPSLGNIVAYERWERLVTLAATVYAAEMLVISWVVYTGTEVVQTAGVRKWQLTGAVVCSVLLPTVSVFGDVNAVAGVDLESLGVGMYWVGCSAFALWLTLSIQALRKLEATMDPRLKLLFRIVKSMLWFLAVLAFIMLVQWKNSYNHQSSRVLNEYGFSVSRWVAGTLLLSLPVLICQFFPESTLAIPLPTRSKSQTVPLTSSFSMELEDYSRS